jgi:two-component system CheB/CheR fusion protein
LVKKNSSASGPRSADAKEEARAAERPDDAPPADMGTDGPSVCVVGIGASAGGYDAIRSFFTAMPGKAGVAFIVVQHLDPSHASLAAELFGKVTAMPVLEARDGGLIEANHVYTSPSDRDLTVRDGRFSLTMRDARERMHLPIDNFFDSLGEGFGARAIGIVLSGTGSDGALGIKSIAAHGGIVLVQDPSTAQFDGMPRSAIATGACNYVLPVENMPEVITAYALHPYAASPEVPDEDDITEKATQSILTIIREQRGYDFAGYKRNTLLRRIRRRMGLRGIRRNVQYAALLKRESGEVDALFRDLLIGVTEFFRDPEAWKLLETEIIAPLVAAKHRDQPIRIWIPGCSTGEEAYTMAMVVLDALRVARKSCPVQIFATDTCEDALDAGRRGRYPTGVAAQIPPAMLARYFVETTDHQGFQVAPALREAVVFGVHNLFADPPFARVDLISCRNVLIYLEAEVQQRIVRIFHFALNADGGLFLGSAESVCGRDDLFKTISTKWRLFRREGNGRNPSIALPMRLGEPRAGSQATPARSAPRVSQAAAVAQQLILDAFSPASVLVNGSYEALYFCGPTDDFLVRPRGAPTSDLLSMVRDGLRSRLRAALRQAALNDATTTVADARMKKGGAFESVQITVMPTPGGELGRLFLVVFQRPLVPALVPSEKTAESVLVNQLEEELRATRDDLQSTIERLEASNEDLNTSNEEVVSVNEELRSLNEELESSKEELQSLNEELNTVNQQLEAKLRELETSNDDLRNVLVSSAVATLCLDPELRIKWFAPATRKLFNLLESDIGRPIRDFSPALCDPGLLEAAGHVLAGSPAAQHEFHTDQGHWYIRHILPYRSQDQTVSGVIINYTGITDTHLSLEGINLERTVLEERYATELRQRTDKLRALSAALAMAEERERRALAQDLHDDLGQMIAVIKLKVSALEALKLTRAQRAALDECSTAVDLANRKLRAMAFQLSPPMLYDLGLMPALHWLADEMRHVYKIDVRIEDDGTPKELDPAISATLFRAVRELLINVAKHADVCEAALVTAVSDTRMLTISVSDAGKGFDPSFKLPANGVGGFGLLSIRERLGYLGGELEIRSNPGDGTSVILRVPLDDGLAGASRATTEEDRS